jgi:hypothetical protein
MKKFELSISPDYVPSWGVTEAVRELFQNAIDQETTQQGNKMFFTYENNTLKIGNKNSTLDIQSLLLGTSTKRNDDKTIGKFGEGYKIASLVLIREGKTITFYNYGNKEVWKPRFVKSRRYNGANILTFFIDKTYFWQTIPDNNLTIEIDGITESEYTDIINSNLHLQELSSEDYIESIHGRILTSDEHCGKVYVNGLYVCSCVDYDYGYDFKPEYINIDRDRKLVSDSDLRWMASRMWNYASQERPEYVAEYMVESVKKKSKDMTDIIWGSTSSYVNDKAYEAFTDEYGEDAVPITNNDEKEQYKHCNTVIVGESYKNLITTSYKYVEPIAKSQDTTYNKLMTWITSVQHKINSEDFQRFCKIVKELT